MSETSRRRSEAGGLAALALVLAALVLALGCGGGGGAGTGGAVGEQHFCRSELSGEQAWRRGMQASCRVVSSADGRPLTAGERASLNGTCLGAFGGELVDDCPRAGAVGTCDVYALPEGLRGERLVYASALTPDTVALALNASEICQGTARDLSGAGIHAISSGSVSIRVDGQPVVLEMLSSSAFKSDGQRSQITAVAADTPIDIIEQKAAILEILEDGGAFRFAMMGLDAGPLYSEGGTMGTYRAYYPVNPATLSLQVSALAPRGARLEATFSVGLMDSRYNDQGGNRTVTDGVVSMTMMPFGSAQF